MICTAQKGWWCYFMGDENKKDEWVPIVAWQEQTCGPVVPLVALESGEVENALSFNNFGGIKYEGVPK